MKRFMAGTMVLLMVACAISIGQELSIGPTGGALFTQGSRGGVSGMRGNGFGTSFSFGGEVVYSLASVPLDLIGQFSYAPTDGRGFRRDSLVAPGVRDARRGNESDLFSIGLGGRWVPLRGGVSPYLGVSFILSHQGGSRFRPDSASTLAEPVGNPEMPGDRRDFERPGGMTSFGVGLSVGSEFVISSLLRLDMGASYTLSSPFARGNNLNTIGFGASVLFNLF
jgi:hypothetical protein